MPDRYGERVRRRLTGEMRIWLTTAGREGTRSRTRPGSAGMVATACGEVRGGDTKTAKSRRTLALPQMAVQAIREHCKRQAEDRLAAGALWQDHGLVFASAIGTPLDAANVRREFRKITEAAVLGTGWAPRDLRHTNPPSCPACFYRCCTQRAAVSSARRGNVAVVGMVA